MSAIPSKDTLTVDGTTAGQETTPTPSLLDVDQKHKLDLEKSDVPPRSPSPGNSTKVESDADDEVVAEKGAATTDEEAAQTHQREKIEPWVFWCAFCSMLCTAFLYGLDTTIAADVQVSIYKSLGEIDKIQWVGIGFPLGSAATILPIGMAYGRFDLKILFLAGLILFEGGSALCGGAPTMTALIWGRVIAGIGGCSIYLGGLNFVNVYTSIKEQSVYNALIGLVWAFGTILGPVIGGAFASSGATWRWAFYINLCLFAVVGPLVLFVMPRHDPRKDLTLGIKLKSMDWVGSVLIAGVLVTFILAFSMGGSTWAWDDGRWIAMIVVFGVLLIAAMVQQAFPLLTTRQNQVFPVWFLKRRTLVLLYVAMAATSAAFFNGIYYIPLYFQFAHNDSPIKAAVRLLPFICLAVFFMMFQGGMLPVVGYYWPWYLLSGIFIMIGGCVMHTITPETSISRVYGFSLFIAIGCGLSAQGGYSLAAAKAKGLHEIAHSIGFMNIGQIGSVAIALCVSGQIFQSVAFSNLKKALAGNGFSDQTIRDTIAGTQSAVFAEGTPEIQAAAVKAITDAIDTIYIQCIACGALIIVVSILMKKEKANFVQGVAGGA